MFRLTNGLFGGPALCSRGPQAQASPRVARVGPLTVVFLLAAWVFAAQGVGAQVDSAATRDSMAARNLLRPGDVIKLTVWREPEWSGEFPVNEAGVATLPRLGAINVTGLTPDSLRRFVMNSLGVFLKNPSIEITPLRRIQVLGAVRTPGLYPVPPTVTVGDVVALAGGATPEGKADQVVLRREGKDVRVKLESQTRLADTPIRTGDQLYVPQRSWISRNGGLFAAGISAATTLIVALIVR
jgi:protein involved in polysaccharide export with SLBB domain